MTSTAARLARLREELSKVEAAAERDWQKRTSGVPDRFLGDLRTAHEQRWAQPRELLRQEIAKLSKAALHGA